MKSGKTFWFEEHILHLGHINNDKDILTLHWMIWFEHDWNGDRVEHLGVELDWLTAR